MREQARSISRGLKVNKNSAEGEVFLVDFPSYRTFQAVRVNQDFREVPRLFSRGQVHVKIHGMGPFAGKDIRIKARYIA